MKINFDELITTKQQLSTIAKGIFTQKTTKMMHKSNNFPYYDNNSAINLEYKLDNMSRIDHFNQNFNDNQKKNEGIHRNKQFLQSKITKIIPNININQQEIIDRLYNKSQKCHKKECKQYKTDKQIQEIYHKYSINGNQYNKKHLKLENQQKKCPTYIKLYNDALIKQNIKKLNQKQTQIIIHNNPQILQTKTSQAYRQNYIPFYQRLSTQITKSKQRQKIYNKNPHLSSNLSSFFKPKIISSRYKQTKSKYLLQNSRQLIKPSTQLYSTLNNSMYSFFSSSQTSLQIINNIQQHFFDKMKLIFINPQANTETNLIITQNMIKMLSQTQFKLLLNFIKDIQINGLMIKDFQYRLRQYYYSLEGNERIQLRNHEIKKNKNNIKINKQQKQTNYKQINDKIIKKSCKNKTYVNDKYLKKIQYYV